MPTPAFTRYVGMDYSGAETPTASLKGLRVYQAEGDAAPVEVLPPPRSRMTNQPRPRKPEGSFACIARS
jgi:hypothetical protein